MKFATITSGSAGNCTYIEGGATSVLVDAGCTNKHLLASLSLYSKRPEDISAIFITHEHNDHVGGMVRFARRFGIPIYASEVTWENLPGKNYFSAEEKHIFEYGLSIGDLDVDFFRLSHDAAQPVGFVFECEEQRVGVATDTGAITPSMSRMLANVDGLVLEANHDREMLFAGPYPAYLKRRVGSEVGHLSNQQAGIALRDLAGERTRAVILAHLSEPNNRPELALHQVKTILGQERDIAITVAPRAQAHPLVEL